MGYFWVMASRPDPLLQLLAGARPIGDEYCWAAVDVVAVVQAFQQLGLLLLGAELWRFEGGGDTPHVVGWLDLDPGDGGWTDRVDAAGQKAVDELLVHASDLGAWVNFTWMAAEDQRVTE
jgi:hypothetical protein